MHPRFFGSLFVSLLLACTVRDAASESGESGESGMSSESGTSSESGESSGAEPDGDCAVVEQWTGGCCEQRRTCPTAMQNGPNANISNPGAVACIFDVLASGEPLRVSIELFEDEIGLVTHDYFRSGDTLIHHQHGGLEGEVDSVSVCELGDPTAWAACQAVVGGVPAHECVTQGLFCVNEQSIGSCSMLDDSGCAALVGAQCPEQAPLGDCELVSQWQAGCCELPRPCPTIERTCTDDLCDEPEVSDPAAVACVYEALAAGDALDFVVAPGPNIPFGGGSLEYWHIDGELLVHHSGSLDLTVYNSWSRCTLADATVLAECAAVQDPLEARACADRFCSETGPALSLGDCDSDEYGDACEITIDLECPA